MPVILDGAQGAGAIHVDVARARLRRLRGVGPEVAVRRRRHRDALARPGVRASGSSWSAPATSRSRTPPPASRAASRDTTRATTRPRSRARRSRCRSARSSCCESHGWDAVHERAAGARAPARRRAARARPRRSRRAARPRSWPGRTRRRGGRATGSPGPGVIVRNLPGRSLLRAVGRRLERRVRPRAAARRHRRLGLRARTGLLQQASPRRPVVPDLLAQHPLRVERRRRRGRLEPRALVGAQRQRRRRRGRPRAASKVRAPTIGAVTPVDAHQPRDRDLRDRRAAVGGDRLGGLDDAEVLLGRAPVPGLLPVVRPRSSIRLPSGGASSRR